VAEVGDSPPPFDRAIEFLFGFRGLLTVAAHTNAVVPPFDFAPALRLSPVERMRRCVDRVRARHLGEGQWDLFGLPPVPDTGASADELVRLELQLGVPLPAEYRAFLGRWRYLILDDGLRVWGFPHGGISVGGPWLSDEHRAGVQYLVFADYWGYADGDQLLFEVGDEGQAVVAYLHEHEPLFESFAPSFSLALWRMVEEWATDAEPGAAADGGGM